MLEQTTNIQLESDLTSYHGKPHPLGLGEKSKNPERGGLCMIGSIYSDQNCPICGGKFKDDGKRGLFCPKHPQCQATKFKVLFKGICRRFLSYEQAQRFLTGLRFEVDIGKFDLRDYQKDNPLGFNTLAEKYLEIKKNEVSSYRQVKYHLEKATEFFQSKNIKTIGYDNLEDFLLAKTDHAKQILGSVSAKTRANIKATLHAFWNWLKKRRIIKIDQFPEFPEIPFELGWRKVIDKGTQQTILDEVYKLTKNRNLKIWIGIKWLATYISIRPKELLNIKEGDFNFNNLGGVFIRKPKEGKPKFVPMLDDDLALVKSFPPALPHLYFFRHSKGYGGVKPGSKMGRDCLYKYWMRACRNLGISGVDLYGGTKHSSATALRKFYSPEQIKRATMHATNRAFERYFKVELDDLRSIYQKSADKVLTKNFESSDMGKIIEITKKK